jgi:hypothetical protein
VWSRRWLNSRKPTFCCAPISAISWDFHSAEKRAQVVCPTTCVSRASFSQKSREAPLYDVRAY